MTLINDDRRNSGRRSVTVIPAPSRRRESPNASSRFAKWARSRVASVADPFGGD